MIPCCALFFGLFGRLIEAEIVVHIATHRDGGLLKRLGLEEKLAGDPHGVLAELEIVVHWAAILVQLGLGWSTRALQSRVLCCLQL